jgi:hypothetical protein
MRRPLHRTLLLAATLLIVAFVALGVAFWARSDERDVRCDRSKRTEVKAKGEEYACLLEIPGHDRGH